MPTYDYECPACGHRFSSLQAMSDQALTKCPECGRAVSRVITGGSGFIVKGGGASGGKRSSGGCSLETTGRTCCGRDQRCGQPPCDQ